MWETIQNWIALIWPLLLGFLLYAVVAPLTTIHIVLTKREVRAAIGWTGLVWLAPLLGAGLYFCFGVNRIQRRATSLGLQQGWNERRPHDFGQSDHRTRQHIAEHYPDLLGLSQLVERLTDCPVSEGNRIEPLLNGDEAFPRMLEAIEGAQQSITLVTYIFDADRVGEQFFEALKRAHDRGVEVRILIDDVGGQYSRPRMVRKLRSAGIPCAAFLPTIAPRLYAYANLRNHRKILVVDGHLGFTGGTNIREGHQLQLSPRFPVQCIHFEVSGPVVRQMQQVFALDWHFTTDENLKGPRWFPEMAPCGDVMARGIPDGPDEDFEQLTDTMQGAISSARESIRIVTPYFLPEATVIGTLNVAAMKGVRVEIFLPRKNNIWLVDWATRSLLPQLIQKGCKVAWIAPPFDHTKLLVVDDQWSLIGSTNWDPRSLRLNFEYNLECYSRELARKLNAIIDTKSETSTPLTLESLTDRPWPRRALDGIARLASPYL